MSEKFIKHYQKDECKIQKTLTYVLNYYIIHQYFIQNHLKDFIHVVIHSKRK